jgi:hypothetical protein
MKNKPLQPTKEELLKTMLKRTEIEGAKYVIEDELSKCQPTKESPEEYRDLSDYNKECIKENFGIDLDKLLQQERDEVIKKFATGSFIRGEEAEKFREEVLKENAKIIGSLIDEKEKWAGKCVDSYDALK